jgi:antitoxin MazE
MVKKLARHGNSLALILDKPILELLNIDENTPLEVSTVDGRSLHIRPVDQKERAGRVNAALKKTNARYGKTLKNLSK